MNSPAMAEQKQVFRYLQKVEIYDLQTLARNTSHIYMKIIAGSTVQTSRTYEINLQSVIIWSMSPDWRSRVPLKPGTLLGNVKKPISDVAANSCSTFSLISSTSATSDICSLKIFCSDYPKWPSPTIGKVFMAMEPIRSIPVMLGEIMRPADILEEYDNENVQSDLGLLLSAVRQPVHHVEPARLTSGAIVETLAAAQNVTAGTEDINPARISNRIHYLHKVEVHGLVALPTKHRLYLEITVGTTPHMSSAYKIPSQTLPNWSDSINLGAYDGSIIVKFGLFINPKTPLMRKESLGWAEQRISAFPPNGDTTISLMKNEKPVSSSLKVFLTNDSRQVAAESIQDTPAPKTSLDGIRKLLDTTDPIKRMIDKIADLHPAAKIAWGVVSVGTDLLRKRLESDEIVKKLYVSMLLAFDQASRHEVLQNRENLKPVYDALFQHTIECSMFIKGYAENKSWAGQISRAFLADTAEEFCDGFGDLRDQLLSNIVAEDLAVTLAVLEKVEEIDMHQLLQDLRPSTSLKPKSICMKGTRAGTINYLMGWIAACNGGMLWCSGLAGTGKSSLVGTLHELLTVHTGGRNRLGAFIRYDRTEYRDASHLITSIAHSLGMFDNRIGTPISTVIRRNRAVLSMSTSSASQQFRLLLQEPLESLRDLHDEGPLVVIIDGMDESDASKEVLAVLSNGFGPRLPFMRLLVFSRPIEHISQVFTAPASVVTNFALDAGSKEVRRDIRYYIQVEFTTNYNALQSRSAGFEAACNKFNAIDELALRSSGLFIWAATVCRFIREWPTVSRLQALLSSAVPKDATESMTTLYKTALDTIVSELSGSSEDVRRCICAVLGAVIVAETPPGLTTDLLDNLVLTSGEDPPAQHVIKKLGSVIHFPSAENDKFICLIHKSFDDFLRDRERCGDHWFIDIEVHKRKLARRCLSSLTEFLVNWKPNATTVPSYIKAYAVVGPLWHIKCFSVQDFEDLHVLFEDQLSKWLQVVSIAGKDDDFLRERFEVLLWVNHKLTKMDDSFRLLTYRACQRAELALITPWRKSYMRTIPVLGSDQPETAHDGPSGAQVHLQLHNILRHPLHLDVVSWFPVLSPSVSSASADSQTLVIKTTNRGSTFITLWDFNEVGTNWDPKPISSYFDAEELSHDPQYIVLGCLVARLVIANYESASDFHSQTYWEVVSPYSDAALTRRSASTFVSIHDIRTSRFHHYVFEQLGTYKSLLYATGIIVVDIQAMALMRIDVTTEHHVPHTWIGINEGDALGLEYNSLHRSFSSPELDRCVVPGQLVVSKDGLTLAHLSQYGGVHQNPEITLRLWNTTTGAILSTHNVGLHEQGTAHLIGISANGTASLLTRRLLDSSLYIIPSDDDAAIDLIHLEEVVIPRMVFFPDERRITYKIRDEIVIRDIQTKQDIFHHPFTFDEEPLDIVITPDGKTLITVHSTHFRTWHVEA